MMWKGCIVILLGLMTSVMGRHTSRPTQGLVNFQLNKTYTYSYAADTSAQGMTPISTKALFSVRPYQKDEGKTYAVLNIETLSITHDGQYQHGIENAAGHLNFKKWFSFRISCHGEVDKVWYPKLENKDVIIIKKSIVSHLSTRLHVSSLQTVSGTKKWAYLINETDSSGNHTSNYAATDVGNSITFVKHKHGHSIPNSEGFHRKTIELNKEASIPKKVMSTIDFTAPNKAVPGYNPNQGLPGDPNKKHGNGFANDFNLPVMTVTSNEHLEFKRITDSDRNWENPKSENVEEDTIHVRNKPMHPSRPLKVVKDQLHNHFTVIAKTDRADSKEHNHHLQLAVELASSLSDPDIRLVAEQYITTKPKFGKDKTLQTVATDVLGMVGTNHSLSIITEFVLLNKGHDSRLVSRAMLHFAGRETPPPKIAIDAIEDWAFSKETNYEDETEHRTVRSMISEKELEKHLHQKAGYIHALGNAAHDTSYPYILSYIDHPETPSLLKRSAVQALRHFNYEEAAHHIMSVALNDPEDHVRHHACLQYWSHPHAANVDEIRQIVHLGYRNTSLYEQAMRIKSHYRNKRSAEWLFRGIDFKVELPGIDWRAQVGTDDIGAKFGLVIRNLMDLQIQPLRGHFLVDIFDTAYARGVVGFVGIDIKFFVGEMCFNGEIKYGLNILQEFGYDDTVKLVNAYDKVINNVVDSVKTAIITFNNILKSSRTFSIADIFDSIAGSIEYIPKTLYLNSEFDNHIKMFYKYNELPDAVERVNDALRKTQTVLTGVRQDVMEFYNSIADAVEVSLPWAGLQIERALKNAAKSVTDLTKSPKTAMANIAKAVAQ
ncbi:unnamed protein product [Owenia fusiformis]|uniref:Vitellogenin domain-containing protein n=1 Tax=Owenia fusiformis TaxID=6347 RepID=A0A8S4PNB5_OWEFU|nr:unnamed protein product [Owenia fusiformis]